MIFGSGVAERYYERWFDEDLERWRGTAPDGPASRETVWYRTLGTQLCGVAIAGPKSRMLLAEVTDVDVSREAMGFGSFTAIDVGWAREYRPTYDPLEAGLGRFIRFTRSNDDGTEFVGRSALIAKYGPQGPGAGVNPAPQGSMALRTWTIPGMRDRSGFDAVADEPIFCNGDPVGWVTSGGYAHYSDASVAMGYVPVEFANDDVEFEIEIVGERRVAHLVNGCLWDPGGTAMRR